jgi:hypothetical protein
MPPVPPVGSVVRVSVVYDIFYLLLE